MTYHLYPYALLGGWGKYECRLGIFWLLIIGNLKLTKDKSYLSADEVAESEAVLAPGEA